MGFGTVSMFFVDGSGRLDPADEVGSIGGHVQQSFSPIDLGGVGASHDAIDLGESLSISLGLESDDEPMSI